MNMWGEKKSKPQREIKIVQLVRGKQSATLQL